MTNEQLLDELYALTQIEQTKRALTSDEEKRYVEIVDILHTENVEIDFAIVI